MSLLLESGPVIQSSFVRPCEAVAAAGAAPPAPVAAQDAANGQARLGALFAPSGNGSAVPHRASTSRSQANKRLFVSRIRDTSRCVLRCLHA
jgi:hypothetical protein